MSRGFYSAVYRARQESLRRVVVLKVSPTALYEFFGKDWNRECEEHAAIAQGTDLVADITDQFVADVDFSGMVLRCNVAVLENIEGQTLEQVLADPTTKHLAPRSASQIAADLFAIMHLFIQRNRFHNDLHAGNVIIQNLAPQAFRSNAIQPGIRAVAIDLGSVLDASRSGDHHVGDQHQIASHIARLSQAVVQRSEVPSDTDYRIAGVLRALAEHLAPVAGAQRLMTIDDALRTINAAITAIDEPWRLPLSLQRFGEAYNAQTLESWHVPELWFDPDGKWLQKTTARGPQVITGMRGCGKTMLLRALHYHARAVQQAEPTRTSGTDGSPASDAFLGVYASCQKLLNPQDRSGEGEPGTIPYPFEKLYVAYLRDAVQVLRHLRSLDPEAVFGGIDSLLSDALTPLNMEAEPGRSIGEQGFEQFLTGLQFRLSDGQSACRLKMAPAEAFGHLAATITAASKALSSKYVLFLLDDVSTRYLRPEMVREVISQLLFQHPHCAFRITTEAQALQRVLRSPGGEVPADPSRDYEEFDLGNEVYRLLQESSAKEKMEFVAEILRRRGRQFKDSLYRLEPEQVLGTATLEDIARDIAQSSATSRDRKSVYRGLRAVQAVCVGDIGDVVKLYEKILQRADVGELPVPAIKQTDCFLEHSASLMHFLNRRDQQKKSLALAYAQAAGDLLKLSNEGPAGSPSKRLRQYTKLYVRVETGADFEDITSRLYDLMDAGVFVYDGGAPRTKTRDDDPVLQFKLSFRKVLGLASFIGLADRDRFELSGKALREWLENPARAKEILLDSEAKKASSSERAPESLDSGQDVATTIGEDKSGHSTSTGLPEGERANVVPGPGPKGQTSFGSSTGLLPFEPVPDEPARDNSAIPTLGVSASFCSLESLSAIPIDAVVLALGFEQRARESANRIFQRIRPGLVIQVEYGPAQGRDVEELVRRHGLNAVTISSIEELPACLATLASVIVDTSGLSKPFLFVAIRELLARTNEVTVVHTSAKEYYPRNRDLAQLGVTAEEPVSNEVFSRLGEVILGEAGPYRLRRVHCTQSNPERWRGLLASASSKNDRLLHLLDARTFDATRILVPPPNTPRRRIARASAELAASVADANVGLIDVETSDIHDALRATEKVYKELYYHSGANVEIGLTGSKIQAVAFAALAAAARVSAAWYVEPQTFDHQRFTEGVGETTCFKLSMRPLDPPEGSEGNA